MEIVQKITIYDILGYTFPGIILIGALIVRYHCKFVFVNFDNGYVIAFIVILGYALGMVNAQLSKLMEWFVKQCKDGDNESTKKEIDRLGCATITKAMKKAGIIEPNRKELSRKEIENYFTYIFADIQIDPVYSRVHNYASSELVCRNMSVVFFISTLLTYRVQTLICDELWVLLGMGASILFLKRYIMNKERKEDYTIDWFVQKYLAQES